MQRCIRALASLAFAGAAVLGASTGVAQSAERFQGILTVVWGDPPPGMAGGEERFTLTLPNGTAYPLAIAPASQNTALHFNGKRVVVSGEAFRNGAGAEAIHVLRIAPDVSGTVAPSPPATAAKPTLFLLLRYKDDSQEPHDPQFYLDLTNPKTPPKGSLIPATLNGFFSKTSWNQLQWQADVGGVGGLKHTDWLTLPFGKTHYANCGSSQACADINAIAADGLALAVTAGINPANYSAINFVLNNDLDCCSWGGSFIYNGTVFHGTWEAPWGQETALYAHELGHALGLPHSGWAYYSYDSPWDVMSMGTPVKPTKCGSYSSANNGGKMETIYCSAPGDGYIAPHKDYLGWIPAANQVVLSAPATKNVTLEANSWPLTTAVKLVKICLAGQDCSGAHAHYLTVEARLHKKSYEKGEPGDGVLVQDFQSDRGAIGGGCFFNNQSGWVVPIDATPGDYDSKNCNSGGRKWPDYALGNAEFAAGQTYNNGTLGVSVQVVKQNASSFDVTVKRTK
ncbi:MAG: hypothetical protein JO208_00045 [Alphaproteobacteria bacterium]|nr:hypothetical protein [Alphaproteobacteria bacterium]